MWYHSFVHFIARPCLRSSPVTGRPQRAIVGGAGMVLSLVLLACAACDHAPGAPAGDHARLANNGKEASEADHPAVVQVEKNGYISTGSLVSSAGHIITAGHTLVDLATYEELHPSSVTVRVNGVSVRAIDVAVHEGFSKRRDWRHDIGIIVIPSGAGFPAPLQFATSSPKPGDAVTVIGFGVLTPNDDLDRDGVRNDFDRCPTTPPALSRLVETMGQRAGCEKDERISALPGTGEPRSPFGSGVLHLGTNVISSIDAGGGLHVQGPFTTTPHEGQVTPAFGDSGGPLLDATGRIVGTVHGGKPILTQDGTFLNEAYFVDVNAKVNKDFIAKAGVTW